MTNQEMSEALTKMLDIVEQYRNSWTTFDSFRKARKTAQKLYNDENLNIDDKKALADLYRSFFLDSSMIWDFSSIEMVGFDAVCEQLGVLNLEYNRLSIHDHAYSLQVMRDIRAYHKYDIGLICSVRTGADKEYIEAYVAAQEALGRRVFYPARDTDQIDAEGKGVNICRNNTDAYRQCYEIHIIFHPESQGSLFDIGNCYSMGKLIHIVNPITPTEEKSFKNVLLHWEENQSKYANNNLQFVIDFDKEIEVR